MEQSGGVREETLRLCSQKVVATFFLFSMRSEIIPLLRIRVRVWSNIFSCLIPYVPTLDFIGAKVAPSI